MPSASIGALRERARCIAGLRDFFAAAGVLEVETPALAACPSPELHLASFTTRWNAPSGEPARLYLQTSPEFAMKRLLAAGSGPIFQISRVFRDHERGRTHNPEFTLLEWYRPGFDHHRLMDEVDALLQRVFGIAPARRVTFAAEFREHVGVDPFAASDVELEAACVARGLRVDVPERAACIDFLFEREIQPRLGAGAVMVHDYPVGAASLARASETDPAVAERFELYVGGLEVANGYRELTDPVEQRRRFAEDLAARARAGRHRPPIDEQLLDALVHGMPECAGVALGIDRLLMAHWGVASIDEVIAFPVDRA